MKMKDKHFVELKALITRDMELRYGHAERAVEAYELGHFKNSEKTADLQKRFCFDMLFNGVTDFALMSDLYSYLNDTHIYTALKKICPIVIKRY